MKKALSFILLSVGFIGCACADSLNDYINYLTKLTDYAGNVHYEVLLPQAEDPVTYDLQLYSTTFYTDTLAPCRYLIEWTPGVQQQSSGFAAYLDGNHYRYRDSRLQEYHTAWDSIPFLIGNGGVQCNAQFVDVLPQFLGREISRNILSGNFQYTFTPDTIYNGKHVAIIDGQLIYNDVVSKEATYIFDPTTRLPLVVEYENNPGSISEQTVTIKYSSHDTKQFPLYSESNLIELHPEVFEKYRESNFKIENLPGTQLPTFTAPNNKGERYTHHHGEELDNPTAIVLLDSNGANTPATIEAVRNAAAFSPKPFDILWAFIDKVPDNAIQLIGTVPNNEVMLTGAKSLARDCGVSSYPTIIYVTRDGIVADVTLGYNKDLQSTILQKTTLAF